MGTDKSVCATYGALPTHHRTLATIFQVCFGPKVTASYSAFSACRTSVWSKRRKREMVSPMSLCQAITILPSSLLKSVYEASTATTNPSWISGVMEFPRTRRQLV